jgi:glycerate dehydrogenase
MHGVFLDTATLRPAEIDLASVTRTLSRWTLHERTAPAQTAERIADAEVIVTNKVVISGEHIRANPQLRLICVSATGVNNVDAVTAAECGVVVRNVENYAAASVAQHTFALLLGLATQWHRYQAAVQAGDWSRSDMFCLMDYPVTELAGKTLGIVGAGDLGLAVARLGEAFGMDVLLAQLPGRPVRGQSPYPRLPFDEFLGASDVVSIHCPLDAGTRDLVGTAQLARMKRTAFLLNTARGGIVNEAALLDALQRGVIAGAALDVLTQEPPPPDHPLVTARLPNLIVTPHNAWVSRECRQRLIDGVARNIRTFLADNPGLAP